MQLQFSPMSRWRVAHYSGLFAKYFLVLAPASTMGSLQAKIDLANGRTKFLYSCLCPQWHLDAGAKLKEKYGIEYINLDDCERYPWIPEYKMGYNKIASDAIRKSFGIDVVEICLKAAESSYRAGGANKTTRLDESRAKIPA